MGVDCIKFIHVGIADLDRVPGSQSAFKICVILGCPVKIHRPPDHIGQYYRQFPIVSDFGGGEPVYITLGIWQFLEFGYLGKCGVQWGEQRLISHLVEF